MILRTRFIVLAFLVVALALTACTDDDEPLPEETATPTASSSVTETPSGTPAPSPTLSATTTTPTEAPEPEAWPAEVRTGVDAVDRVIDAVLSGDPTALEALVVLTTLECVAAAEGAGGPPVCDEGVSPGTEVSVFLTAACEGFWVPLEGVPSVIEGVMDTDPQLYAVFEPANRFLEDAPYTVMLSLTVPGVDAPLAVSLAVGEEGLFGALYHCVSSPAQILPAYAEGATFLLPPPTTATLPSPTWPADTRTGIEAVDAVLDAVVANDEGALRALLGGPTRPCVVEITSPGEGPECPEGVAVGTPVEAVASTACEGAYHTPDMVALTAFLERDPRLYAVLADPAMLAPPPATLIVFESRDGRAGGAPFQPFGAMGLGIEPEGVSWVWYGCEENAATFVARNLGTDTALILEPPEVNDGGVANP